MILHLAFSVVLLGLTVLNYYAGRRNVLYPPFLFALIWLAVFFIYLAPPIEVDKVQADTLAVVFSGVVAFSAGGAVVGRRRNSSTTPESTPWNTISKKIIFLSCLAILPAFFLEIQRLSDVGGIEGLMISARVAIIDAVTNGERPFGSPVYSFAVMLAIFGAFIFLIEARDWRRERLWVWGSILTALTFCVLTTGRTWLLELVAGLVGIYLLKRKRFSARDAWRFVRWPLAGFLVLFSILVLVNKDISGMSGGATEAIATNAFGYTVVPLAGFDYVLHHASEYKHDSNHTFRDVLPGLAWISGLRYTPQTGLDDYVLSLRYPTNVFTVFKFYYVDFGLAGMLLSMFVIGAGQTWLFRRALTGDHFYIFLFVVSLFPLTMVAFDDQYSLGRYYLGVLVFAALYFRVLRTIPLRARAGGIASATLKESRGVIYGSGTGEGRST